MQYKLVETQALRVVGAKMTSTMEDNKCFAEIPAFWTSCYQQGVPAKLIPLMDSQPKGIMGISAGDITGSSPVFDYYVAVASSQPAPQNMHVLEIPPYTWAVFACSGPMPTAVQEMSGRIMTEWLPTSGYELGNGPSIELYADGDTASPDYRCQIWVTVKPK